MNAATRRAVQTSILTFAVGALSLIGAEPASAGARADGSNFGCRASALRVQLAGQNLLEPIVANAAIDACARGTAALIRQTTIGPITIDAATADTIVEPADLSTRPAQDGDNARSSATVTNPIIDLGAVRLTAGVLGAATMYRCTARQPVASGGSVVANINLTIAGQNVPIVLPANNAPFTLDLPGGLGTLLLNQQTVSGGRITQRALELRLPASGAIADIVIGEATTSLTSNPCAAATPVTPPATPPQCSDGRDNDGDGVIDGQDPGCLSGPGGTYNPQDDDERNPATPAQCSDGRDNDGDGRADAKDPGCLSGPGGTYNPQDDDERNGPASQCSDGRDNDGDGDIDFPADKGCSSREDRSEMTPTGTSRLTSDPARIARQGTRGRCVRGSFLAIVTGRSIQSVVFALDGRPVRTDRTSPFTARISTSRAGTHRVRARVAFLTDSGTATRTLSFAYRRCAAADPGPRFTG